MTGGEIPYLMLDSNWYLNDVFILGFLKKYFIYV